MRRWRERLETARLLGLSEIGDKGKPSLRRVPLATG